MGQIRIIGGQLRGRKLPVPDVPDLRPTPDRVRETLFNWLAPMISDAKCLDLFAGSGALGLEALSRGAQHVLFVDTSKMVADHLQTQLQRLQLTQASVRHGDALKILPQLQQQFDVVFLDPPFKSELLAPTIAMLQNEKILAATAWIYIECNAQLTELLVPAHWYLHRKKQAGQVAYQLFKVGE